MVSVTLKAGGQLSEAVGEGGAPFVALGGDEGGGSPGVAGGSGYGGTGHSKW